MTATHDRRTDLRDVDLSTLDPERLASWQRYLADYFNADFRPGMGTEVVLEIIAARFGGGDWLDLGAGTSTLFWGLAASGATSVTAADASPEALVLLRAFAQSTVVPGCYAEVLERLGKPRSHLGELRSRLRRFLVFDVFGPWPLDPGAEQFDVVTAMGLLGLGKGPPEFKAAVAGAARHLRPGGRLIGADWIRSRAFAARDGHDNAYVDAGLILHALAEAGLVDAECRHADIDGDELFDRLYGWAATRPPWRGPRW